MQYKTTEEIRKSYINYFKKMGHSEIPSSPVVPHQDPSLLFINAGMNQFKDIFLGKRESSYKRAVTCQKCIRGGGKHNDLENVGHTTRHLTFFEMLGNFSFGDYFKEDAIKFAWEVSTQVFGFDPDRIWPTVFKEDDEAFAIWCKYVPAAKITRMGEKDNFWAMGDTGPCGPCSELLYDRGEAFGPAKSPGEDPTGERYLEFWNLVFMQYNRNSQGQLEELPKKSIDTGAGLERVLSLILGVHTVFETDIFQAIIEKISALSGIPYKGEAAFHVIADHLRSLAFAIADGVQPSNVDRGYVLRKILRRAVRYGRQLKFEEPFLAKLLPTLISKMGAAYPELKTAEERIAEILTLEEDAFLRTLKRGGNLLSQVIQSAKAAGKMISGEDAFKLKDTYGLPFEEIVLIATDNDLSIDLERYSELEKEARERSKSAHKQTTYQMGENIFESIPSSHFEGYAKTVSEATITGIVVNGKLVESIAKGQKGMLLLDFTPFYAEKGGQVGDVGQITNNGNLFTVEDCQSPSNGLVAHTGTVQEGSFRVNEKVVASIDEKKRKKIQNNHTATHLLHWALQEVIGAHVKQAGSLVDETRIRFDFNHHKALSAEEIASIEDLVNAKIRDNTVVETYEIPYDEAQKQKEIKQFFGDKYGSVVRVVDIQYSKELCGGTHTTQAGTIGYFRIVKEGSIAAGVRRIEAVTGKEAEAFARDQSKQLQSTLSILQEEKKKLEEDLKRAKKANLFAYAKDLVNKQVRINEIPVLLTKVETLELKDLADELMRLMPNGILALGSSEKDKCTLLVRVAQTWTPKINANTLIKEIGPIIGGSGGGRADAAQAGGKLPEKLPLAFEHIKSLIGNA